MQFEVTFEEIYSEEITLAKQIVETVKRNKNKLVYDKFVFGARYKAYLNNDNKYVMCSCDKKSIENRIKLFNKQYFVSMNNQWKYFDYVYNRHIDNPTLEYFLGLPEELNIDYSKDIVSQITFEDKICHRCCGVDYQYLIQQENSKKQVDKRRDIEKENYFISKGFHYTPIYKKSYVLLDELCDEDKENLQFDLNDFNVKDKVCVGYQTFIDNPDKDNQIEQLKKFLTLTLDKQLNALYIDHKELRNELTLFKDSDYDFYNKIEQVCNKKVREIQSIYTHNFPVSTSPEYLFTKLYGILVDSGLRDFAFYMNDDKENEELDYGSDLAKLHNIIVKCLNDFIDLGGDFSIIYPREEWDTNDVFPKLITMVNDEKLNEKYDEIIKKFEDKIE